ncbi:MAG: hypothetical protein WA871_15125 [Candidatus Acidiferrales bacterium]
MRFLRFHYVLFLTLSATLVGCSSHPVTSSVGVGSVSNTTPVALLMTDSPPAGVTVLSFEVTVTSAELEPGNVPLLTGPATVEITRLQTETISLATLSIAPANFTSMALTFLNPTLTFENNTGASITAGGISCAVGAVCTINPTATNQTTTLSFPSSFAVSKSSPQAVLVDVNLANLLSGALAADFSAGSSVSAIAPSSPGLAIDTMEDFVGEVQAENTANSTITLGNSMSSLVATVNSSTVFLDFPKSTCPTGAFSCLADNQILSADLSLESNGTIVANNLWFKDADSSDIEVEGVITGVNIPAQQFTYVVLIESSPVLNLSVGNVATVHWNVAPATTTFVPDDMGIDTTGFLFSTPVDLMIGQEVSVRRNPTSIGVSLNADRVLLRGSRITAIVGGPIAFPNLTLTNLPSLFGTVGTSQIVASVSTTTGTEFTGAATAFNEIPINGNVSVRGQLFPNGGTPTMLASKIVLN